MGGRHHFAIASPLYKYDQVTSDVTYLEYIQNVLYTRNFPKLISAKGWAVSQEGLLHAEFNFVCSAWRKSGNERVFTKSNKSGREGLLRRTHTPLYYFIFWTTEQEKQLAEIIIRHNCAADSEEGELFGFPTIIIDSSKLAQSETLHTI